MSVTPEMLGRWDDRSKHQPAGVDAAFFGLGTQIAFDQPIRLKQPKDAARNRAKQTHPDIEKRRGDLVAVVETAEHHPFGWQSIILWRGAIARYLAPSVVHLIAAGKVNQSFREERLLEIRHHMRIDHDIVDEICAHGGGKTEIAHLHRRRAIGGYRRP